MMTPQQYYQTDIEREGFRSDPLQAAAVTHFQRLYNDLLSPSPPPELSFMARLKGRRPQSPRGLYLWGGAGRGKTYLMDRFCRSLPFAEKRRLHFHHFMRDVHRALRQLPPTANPLRVVARNLAADFRVLCLDEFHVQDIGDAMLLAVLLEALFEHGITLVTTSNITPDQLYKNGLQRQRFLPAIELIQRHTQLVDLNGAVDYRLDGGGSGHYQVCEQGRAEGLIEAQFREISGVLPQWEAVSLCVNGRNIEAVAVHHDVAWFDFDALCATPRSVADYIELAVRFRTLLVTHIPQLGEGRDDAVQRFIHLIDTAYDHRMQLVATAAAPVEALYQGRHHGFAFQRTISRLHEMCRPGFGAAHSVTPDFG